MPSENLSDGISYLYCCFSSVSGVFLFFSFAPKPKRLSESDWGVSSSCMPNALALTHSDSNETIKAKKPTTYQNIVPPDLLKSYQIRYRIYHKPIVK
nr:MAG TPA: hypothetical protein [Caudoviricetes sp.]